MRGAVNAESILLASDKAGLLFSSAYALLRLSVMYVQVSSVSRSACSHSLCQCCLQLVL